MGKQNKKAYSIISGLLLCLFFLIIVIWLSLVDFDQEKNIEVTFNDKQEKIILSYIPKKNQEKKIILLSSIKNRDSCVRDHVKFLKNRFIDTGNIPDSSLIFGGLDALSYDKFMRYRRVFRLKSPVFLWENRKNDHLVDLNLPIFIIINEKNQIVKAWASKLELFHLTIHELEKHIY